jgi:oxygen-dependent protoporphyrinogen oxidase
MSGRTIVVGAGLSGLAAAHALVRRGEDVLVLEASERPGGVVRTERRSGFLLEAGPNTVRPSDELWGLIDELGLSSEVVLTDPRSPRFIDFGGALHPVPMSPAGFVTSRLLSTAGKLRLLAEPFVSRGTDDEESVGDFVARRLGTQVAERLVDPFVGGVFAGTAASLAVSAAFPTLHRWEREHGSLLAGAIAERARSRPKPARSGPKGLVSFREGLEALPRALARWLEPTLRCGVSVGAVAPRGTRWTVSTESEEFGCDRVILATPAYRASALVSAFAPDAAGALDAVSHSPLAVLHLTWGQTSLPRPLTGFGHLVAASASRRILGAVWSSSLFPGRAPAGRALLTVFLGGSRDPRALELSDDELVAAAARDLEREGLVRGEPEPVLVTRWARAIPQYERGHAARMQALAEAERRFPGLRLIGNYRGGVSVVDVLRSGLAAGADP